MLILRQSTSIDIRVGPFVDSVDGVTPETGITLGAADQAEVLKENGAATVTMAGAFVAITGADGWYDYTVATGDVDTVGEIVFVVQDQSVSLPVFVRAYVIEEAVYDALYDATSAGPLQGTTPGNTLDVNATGEAGLDWANIGSPTTAQNLSGTNIDVDQVIASVSGAVGSVTGHTAQTGDSFARIGVAGAGLTNIDLPNQTMDITGSLSGSVGSVTGAVGSVTGAVTVGTINANVINAASIAAAAMNGKGDWNIGKTGYSLTQTFPTNFADMAIAVTTGVVAANLTEYLGSAAPALVGGRFDSSTGAMAAGVVTAAAIATDAIDDDAIATGAIASTAFAAGAINAAAIANSAIDAATFAAGALDANALAADAVDKIRDGILPTQNVAFPNLEFLFVAASDHVTPVTGATGTGVTRSIDGGSFGAGTGTLAEVGNGIYQYDASAADMNGGVITFRFVGTGGTPGAPDDAFVTIVTGGGV